MSRRSDRGSAKQGSRVWRASWRALRVCGMLAGTALAGAALSVPRVAAAQTPPQPPPRPTVPPDSSVRDSTARDTLGLAPAQRDSVRAISDSTARDSVVARSLRAQAARKQSVFELLDLDRLQLTTIGVTVGMVQPASVIATRVWSVQADYGEIVRGVRVVFQSSYWSSRYRDAAVRGLERALAATVVDPARDDTLRVGRVDVSDLSLGVDARWRPRIFGGPSAIAAAVHPWVGIGTATHFVNAEGGAISGTFVEGALDGVATGLGAAVGLDVSPLPNLQLTMQARYDLFSGVRYGSLRAGGSWIFEPARMRARVEARR